jgi:type IV pilus assembly protein PilB
MRYTASEKTVTVGYAEAAAPMPPAARLGDRLIAKGWITSQQLEEVLAVQQRTGGFLGEILLSMGLIAVDQLGPVLEEIYRVPYVDLSHTPVDPAAVRLVPSSLAQRRRVLPLRLEGDRLVTAMVDPLDLSTVDELRLLTRKRIVPVVTTERDLTRAFYDQFSPLARARDAIAALEESPGDAPEESSLLEQAAGDTPIISIVNSILSGAVAAEASDIHLEPQEKGLRVRYRMDGLLQEQMVVPQAQQAAVLSRIKIMANMDIAETRRSQDGRSRIRENGRDYDLRVSSLPTVHGEKLVLRLLDQEKLFIPIEKLGLLPEQFEIFDGLIGRGSGMLLVTGPTGSGKSTTLYATLNRLNHPNCNISTIEDPVEYRLAGINQTQVNPRAGITFATGLRTLLRQDPDIILVGEIRDRETVDAAVQAALTGHLVLATLHTTTAPGAVTRLINMGLEPFLIAASLTGVVAQRLARRVCPRCDEEYVPAPEVVAALGLEPDAAGQHRFRRGVGCRHCKGTGYRGRTAVYEVLPMSERLRAEVMRQRNQDELQHLAVLEGMLTLRESAVRAVLQGLTTPEEVARLFQSGEPGG